MKSNFSLNFINKGVYVRVIILDFNIYKFKNCALLFSFKRVFEVFSNTQRYRSKFRPESNKSDFATVKLRLFSIEITGCRGSDVPLVNFSFKENNKKMHRGII